MKKIALSCSLIMMLFFSAQVFAQAPASSNGKEKASVTAKTPSTCCQKTTCTDFVDKNGDGKCDNCKSANCNKETCCVKKENCKSGTTNGCCGKGMQNHGEKCPAHNKTK